MPDSISYLDIFPIPFSILAGGEEEGEVICFSLNTMKQNHSLQEGSRDHLNFIYLGWRKHNFAVLEIACSPFMLCLLSKDHLPAQNAGKA